MNLHENKELFAELLTAASQLEEQGGLGIRQAFLEKDYWVTRSLQMLADFNGLWQDLQKVYEAELPGLAYRPVPEAAVVAGSMGQVLDVVREVENTKH